MNKFLIKKSEYFDEYGKLAHEFYYIQERKKFLWWEYLKTIKHTECYGSGCSKSKTTFRTLEEAKDFIKEVLEPSKPRNTHTSKPIVETTWRGGRQVDMSRVTFPTKEKQSVDFEKESQPTLHWDSLPTPKMIEEITEGALINEITEGAHTTFKYNGALMIVDYFKKSDTWQCMDARFTIKGRGKTKMGAICDAKNQWDEYLKK